MAPDISIAVVSQALVEPFLKQEWATVDVDRAAATALRAWRRQEYCLAAYDGDEIVGAAVYRILGGVAHLENLIVTRGRRRRGLGGCLLEEFIRRAEALGCHKLTLRAAETDELVRFYRRHGFEVEARFADDVFRADRGQMARFLRYA